MAVDLKVARVVVASMGGEIIVTMAAEAAVEAATVEAATVEAAGADMEAVRVGIRKMKETKSQLAVLLVFFCVRCEFKYYTREIYYIVYLFRKC
jgi:ABC-type polysaccharide transport system permease subunit